MRLLALDGNSLAYRAFFALPDTMATVDGEVTNAVFGFCSMFATLVKDHDPDGIIVVFDRKEKTFRHEAAPEYKAQREKQPDTLYSQMDVIKGLLASAGVLTLDKAGYEGDDIIATIAANIGNDDELLIVTGDRDSYQLVRDPQVRVVYNLRGVTEYAIYDEAGIKTRTGVTPAQYADYAALRGDPSDNLEGVPGVGEKTAAKLINAYGTLEAVFDHADEQTPKLRESLHASRERVLRNARLMRLATDVPVELDRARFAPTPDVAAVQAVFARLEFSAIAGRWKPFFAKFAATQPATTQRATTQPAIAQPATPTPDNVLRTNITRVTTPADAVAALQGDARTPVALAAAWEGEPGRSALVGLVTSRGTLVDSAVSCTSIPAAMLADKKVASALRDSSHFVVNDARNLMRGLLAINIDI